MVWSAQFGPALVHDQPIASGGGLRVITHNLRAANPDVRGSSLALLRARPDLLALQEVPRSGQAAVAEVLDPALPFHVLEGRTGLWSRYPLRDPRLIVIGTGDWTVLRAVVTLPRAGGGVGGAS